jgi:hypothetical protein
MKVDLTLSDPDAGVWRVETEDGVFDYLPQNLHGARRRFDQESSPWASLSKVVDKTEIGLVLRVVRTRGAVPPRRAP